MEDKQSICDALLKAVQLTRAGRDIEHLIYFPEINGEEIVRIIYGNGYHRDVVVTADSGVSTIRDIMRNIH